MAFIALIMVITVLSACIDLPGASDDAMTQQHYVNMLPGASDNDAMTQQHYVNMLILIP